jgi:hypothetical protein
MPGATKARSVDLPLGALGYPLPLLGFKLLARVEGEVVDPQSQVGRPGNGGPTSSPFL